jgi:ribose-phosphate pyrophosphokinase
MKDFLLFSGSSNLSLAQKVAKILGVPLGNVDLTRFADGELRPWIQEDVRDKTVFVLESLATPMDEYIMELVLMGDAIRRSAPRTMVAVVPYMGYARQDKQHRVGEPVSARVIAKFIEVSKYQEVITVDLHNDAIVGFFEIPVTHVSAQGILEAEVKKLGLKNGVVISPDVGGVKRARNIAYELNLPMVVMEKKRYLDRRDTSESFQIIGDVAGRDAIIMDDVVSTGGTIVHSATSLKEAGATSVTVLATHGVLAGDAAAKLAAAPIDHIVLTDTIAQKKESSFDRLRIASVAPLLADAIRSIVR